jgi:hypothetical protein
MKFNRKPQIALFLAAIFFLTPTKHLDAQTSSSTLLGVHSNVTPSQAEQIKIDVVRVILYGPDILSGNYSTLLEQMKTLQSAGYKGVISVSWNNYPGGPLPGPLLPPIGSEEYNAKIAAWVNFLTTCGPYLYAVNIDGEPVLNYQSSDLMSSSGQSNAIEWFQALASVAGCLRTSHPALSHLLIGTPSISDWINIVNNTLTPYDEAFFQWAVNDPNIDLIDVHAHVRGTSDIESIFSFLSKQINAQPNPKILTATEWSQAAVVRIWLNQHPTVSSAQEQNNPAYKEFLNGSPNTNREYVLFLEQNPTDLDTWNTFIATAPYDPNFMTDAFEIMQSYNLLFACYESVWQGTNPNLNTKVLYATLTVASVQGVPQPNYKFLNWFMAIPR